ncbi:MAG TPA: SpaA isopeptide-forming pilin-related protein [candidate division Zixibacteria bacterium]|nr:SpaA isopeptide-forming pilin-related protein [candidate division Zixibacteria bacterium]
MDTRANPFRAFPILIAFLLNVVIGPLAPLAPMPTAPVLALAPSTFDATDGNLVDDGADETDWCTPAPNRVTQDDTPSGSNDTSFASNNNKEDSDVPTLAVGTIPNNKDDLLREYIASETVNGDLFVYLAWIRADSTGTSTIDFEFNQSDELSSNGVTHVRTDGDLLITFDFQANPGSQGGYSVNLELRVWDSAATDNPDPTSDPEDTGKWGPAVDLDASGLAEGSVNGEDVSDCVEGGTLGTGTFGEAVLNLTEILGGDCRAFGSVFTKSRSSNSFSADLKDRIDPVPVNFSTCGQITILKQDENGEPLGGATFSVTPNPFTLTGSLSVTDNQAPDDNDDPGVIHLSDVEPGTYEVCETDAPDGYIIDTDCQELTVAVNGSATFGPFVNGLGDISWTKVDEQTGEKICCATFTLEGIDGAADGFGPITVVDNGTSDEDPDVGELLVTGLLLGTYRITETAAPSGYDLPDPAFQDVVLSGETASAANPFRDPPQADASIDKSAVLSPIVAGETASFTIVVTAGGTGTSEDVVLTDLNETDHTWTVGGDDAADCDDTSIDPGETLTCEFGDVSNGDTRTITISMTSDEDDCELGIANTAKVESSNDHDSSNNEDSAEIDVLCPNPGVLKDAQVTPIVFGEDAVFTVTVTAGGTGPAQNVVLTDENTTGHDWTVSGADAAACADTTVADGETLTCTWAEIPAGASRSITITMTSSESDCELGIQNTAKIEADADVDAANNEDGAEIEVLCPDPSVEKDAELSPINAGDPASFDIVVTAGGTGDSENVVLTDLNATSHTWTVGGPDASACADTSIDPGETLACEFGTIPNGESRSITISMTSSPDDCAEGISNTATISADADADESNNSDSASITVECPDVVVEKTGSGTVNATDSVFFEITVSNLGDGDAYDFQFNDTLPDVSGGWTLVAPVEPGCQLNGNVLTCSREVFEAGDSFTLRVEADTEFADCGELENLASASASNEADEDLDNNSDGHTIVVECPALTASKEADASVVSAGQQIGFTITVSNADEDDTGVAYDVTINDPLPSGSGLDWSEGPDSAACEITGDLGAQVLECDFGDLDPGASVSVHVVSDTSEADCATYPNVATVGASNHPTLMPEDDVTVQCPGLNIMKTAGPSPIDAGEDVSFTVTVWNTGPGTALDVTVHDELPAGVEWGTPMVVGGNGDECSLASSMVPGQPAEWSFDCSLGDLGPVDGPEDGVQIVISGSTDREDCGLLENLATADASNHDEVGPAEASVLVTCPAVAIEKVNDQTDPVLPGTVVSYTLTVTVSDGPAEDVVVTDVLPLGLDAPTSISDGGTYAPATRTITWNLGDLADGSRVLTYQAAVSADVAHGETLTNVAIVTSQNSQCPDAESLGPECEDDSTVTTRVPELVIDKAASTETVHFVFDPEGNVISVTPEQVTWTLTYTLTNGPVTNAVITDPLPEFLTFVSASDGGAYDDASRTITWNLGTLTSSGSVTFATTVDPDAPETEPIVNVATIDSDETEPDDGEDSVTVTSESELANTPTPKPSVPNTALVTAPGGEPLSLPLELMVILFAGSLGTLVLANVRAVRRRR